MTWFFTSDLHLGHAKEFLYGPRGAKSVEEHDQRIIDNWKSRVTDNDIVVIVGDLLMGKDKLERAYKYFDSLPFGEIIYYLGNHCPPIHRWDGKPTVKMVDEKEVITHKQLELGKKLVTITSFNEQDNLLFIKEHRVSIGHLPFVGSLHKDGEVDEREAHLPFPVDNGTVRVHGHTHRQDRTERTANGTLQVHVGIDAFPNFTTAEEIAEIIKENK